jgi:hypothetical protein
MACAPQAQLARFRPAISIVFRISGYTMQWVVYSPEMENVVRF